MNFDDLAVAWATYRKEYGPTDTVSAYKAFVAGWEAAFGLAGDEGPLRTDTTTAYKAFVAGWEAAYGLAEDEGPLR